MDQLNLLKLLSSDMALEPAEDTGCPQVTPRQAAALNISSAAMPNGKRISYLKTLLTSACERNCNYCPFRAGRDFRRATLKPDDMAQMFSTLYRARLVEGMFLSSGVVNGGVHSQDGILDVAEILRNRQGFTGYLHLKLMPGAQAAQIERAMQLADRVSINLEAPTVKTLEKLAPRKAFMEELLEPLRIVEHIRRTQPDHHGWHGRWPSVTTQFVVGAVGETDLELMQTTAYLTRHLHLARAYFSSFHPMVDTPFENLPASSPTRQLRLYQASFLLRDYGFDLEDLPFTADGRLPEQADPKLVWAQANLSESPLEINRADLRQLLRIPGIGVKGARAIIEARRKNPLKAPEDLSRLGVAPARALPFILIDGRRPARQLPLPTLS